jgi:hypothetical protein
MGLDLTQFDTVELSDTGVALELRHPGTGEILRQPDGSAVVITLAGPDGERCRKQNRIATKKALEIIDQGRDQTEGELNEEELDMLAALTLSWSGVSISKDGADLSCTLENAKIVYRRFPAFRMQVNNFVKRRVNFMRASTSA